MTCKLNTCNIIHLFYLKHNILILNNNDENIKKQGKTKHENKIMMQF